MKTKDITPSQYAKAKQCSLQNITKHLRKGNTLEDVISVTKYSRFYLLTVPLSFNDDK